ncbi:hypothetical protein G6F68_012554 [Rhizopus microsporus]|nr:hypothetical protein G6F68_012554 [Rhizopus microsporus]
MDNLERIGHVKPGTVLAPLVGESWGYRRKGRFSVRRVEKKDKTLVGFREQDPRFVADLGQCLTVIPEIGTKVEALSTFIESLDGKRDIPQIEFIAGDQAVVLTVRHLQPLSDADRAAWAAFGQQHAAGRAGRAAVVPAGTVGCRAGIPPAGLHPGQCQAQREDDRPRPGPAGTG